MAESIHLYGAVRFQQEHVIRTSKFLDAEVIIVVLEEVMRKRDNAAFVCLSLYRANRLTSTIGAENLRRKIKYCILRKDLKCNKSLVIHRALIQQAYRLSSIHVTTKANIADVSMRDTVWNEEEYLA